MKLFYRKFGHGCPLIILHGLYGASDNWVSFAKSLAAYFRVYLPDQRNHGQSPNSEQHTYTDLRNDLVEFISDHHIVKPVLIGHSMGGKTAMFFAARFPEMIRALVVIDISPRSYDEQNELSSRFLRHSDILRILSDLPVTEFKTRDDADKALMNSIRIERIRQFLLKNLTRDKEGHFIWKLNLEALGKNLNNIMTGLEHEEILPHHFPVLFVKGARSDYISGSDTQLISKMFPEAQLKIIEGAGHWVHVENPDELFRIIYDFLKSNRLCD